MGSAAVAAAVVLALAEERAKNKMMQYNTSLLRPSHSTRGQISRHSFMTTSPPSLWKKYEGRVERRNHHELWFERGEFAFPKVPVMSESVLLLLEPPHNPFPPLPPPCC